MSKVNEPQIIKMTLDTYEGKEGWKSVNKMTLTPDQEKRIAKIWNEASNAIKAIVFERETASK